MVIKNFSAGTTRAGITHLPEIVGPATLLIADAHNAISRHTRDLIPDLECFIVRVINSDHQTLRINTQPFLARHKFPCELDSVLFEVIAKTEVAHHLEKGVMAGGIANILQIVMFATGTHAALRGCGADI